MMRRSNNNSVVMTMRVTLMVLLCMGRSVAKQMPVGVDAFRRGSVDVTPRSNSDSVVPVVIHSRYSRNEVEMNGISGDGVAHSLVTDHSIATPQYTSITTVAAVNHNNKIDCRTCGHRSTVADRPVSNRNLNRILAFRGGQAINRTKKSRTSDKIKDALGMLLPATRVYLLLSIFCTAIQLLGVVDVGLLGLNAKKLHQLWRPITSVSYLGTPSWVTAYQVFYIISYGQNLELGSGTGVHAWFLLTQTVILTLLGLLFNMPLLSRAMIASIVYVSCRINPFEKTNIQFGITISMWQMPYFLMIADCLTMQSIDAAWPYLLGIFSGHIYHFLTAVWPSLGGREWLKTPDLLIKLLGDKPTDNFSPDGDKKAQGLAGKKLLPKFSKAKKGRKLGS